MLQALQVPVPRIDGKLILGARSSCDSLVDRARVLRCESSEDGDGTTVRSFSDQIAGNLPVSLCFAVQLDFFSEVKGG